MFKSSRSSKSSKPSKGASSSSSKRRSSTYTSFIFVVNELAVNHEMGAAAAARSSAYWTPPTSPGAYGLKHIGRVYRWRNGEVEELKGYQWRNWSPEEAVEERARGVVVHPSEQMLVLYTSASVFYSNRFTHFNTARGDATIRDTYHADPEDQWQRLSFHGSGEGDPIISYASHAGEYDELVAPGHHFVPQLLPEAYDYHYDGTEYDMSEYSTGLSGDLAILIALVAFSCRHSDLHTVLTTDRAWRNGRWAGHARKSGRQEKRGLVVSVFLDPDNEDGSNFEVLDELENGVVPIFRAGR